MMAVKVERSILALAVRCLMRLFDDHCSAGTGTRIVSIHRVDKDRQRLSSISKLRSRCLAPRTSDHQTCARSKHLRSAGRLSLARVLDKSEHASKPLDRRVNILIDDMRQNRLHWDRTVDVHAGILRLALSFEPWRGANAAQNLVGNRSRKTGMICSRDAFAEHDHLIPHIYALDLRDIDRRQIH